MWEQCLALSNCDICDSYKLDGDEIKRFEFNDSDNKNCRASNNANEKAWRDMQVYIIQNGKYTLSPYGYIISTWIPNIHVSKGLERSRRMLIKMLTVILSGWLEFRVNLH